jgi:GAF domain-containing protein
MNQDQDRTSVAGDGPRRGSRNEIEEAVGRVRSLLGGADIDAALRYVNGRTRFRFTGIFQVDPPVLRNVRLIDRENPTLNISGAVSTLDIGYCGIACSTRAPFVTGNAREDARLQSHPARDSMVSYAGVPIRMPGGMTWGTLCHFDGRPRLIAEQEIPILEALTPLIAAWLARNWGNPRFETLT